MHITMSNVQNELLDFKVPSDVHLHYPGSYEKDSEQAQTEMCNKPTGSFGFSFGRLAIHISRTSMPWLFKNNTRDGWQ